MANSFKLKIRNGQASFYLFSNGDYSHDLMSEKIAREIIKNGSVSISDKVPGFPLCVDNKYFFEASEE